MTEKIDHQDAEAVWPVLLLMAIAFFVLCMVDEVELTHTRETYCAAALAKATPSDSLDIIRLFPGWCNP